MTNFTNCSKEAKEAKETTFTEVQSRKGWVKATFKPVEFEEVKYLGNCKQDGHIFAAYDGKFIRIYKGIKGDEFN